MGNRTIKPLLMGMALSFGLSNAAMALPVLQLGPGDATDPDWNYGGGTPDTWVLNGLDGVVMAYANAENGNGDYGWDAEGAADQYAYLVIAAAPKGTGQGPTDVFDVTVTNDGQIVAMYDSGYGNPPVEDPNSLADHGVFDSYFEIYRFQFDGPIVQIHDVQPGQTGTGDGFMEAFNITVNSLSGGADGVHFDLFTVIGDGTYQLGSSDRKLVKGFAPYSHDAEFHDCCDRELPAPMPIGLLGLGLVGLYAIRRRAL